MYLGLAIAVAGPLLAPGLVLAVDLSLVPHPHLPTMYQGLAEGTHEGALSRLPLDALFVGLGRVGLVGAGEKALLLAIVFLSGWGMHRATPSRDEVGRTFAGVLYAVNPFTYDRLYTGQWFLLLGYALLPLAFSAFAGALAGRRRDFWLFVALGVAVGVCSPHMFLLLWVLCLSATVAGSIGSSRRGAVLGTAGAAAAAVVLPSLYWLVPTPGLADFWRHVGSSQLSLYATVADPGRGLLTTVAGLGGYWNNTQPVHSFQPLWPLFTLGLVALAVWGLVCLRRNPTAWAVGAAGAIGLLLALGANGPFGSAFRLFLEHVPAARSLREPQKGVALLVFAYAWLGGAAVEDLRVNVRRHGSTAAALLACVVLALPLGLGYRQLGGLWGVMETSRFPESWHEASALLEREARTSRTLVLPWHGYLALSFAGGRIVANPAPSFFATPVLSSRSVGGGPGTSDNSDPLDAALTSLLERGSTTTSLGACLAPFGVSHVLLAREADHTRYAFLSRQRDLVVERRWRDLVLYRNTVPASLVMQSGTIVRPGSCPPAGTLEPLPYTAAGPARLRVDSAPRGRWIVLATSFRRDWTLSGSSPSRFAGAVVAFPASALAGGREIRLGAADVYGRNYVLGMVGALAVVAAWLAGRLRPGRQRSQVTAAPLVPGRSRVWIVLPTYNEAENVDPMVRALLGVVDRHGLDGHILIVDDASPDGTGLLADGLADEDPRVRVLHRATKDGLGRAYAAGFRVALERGAELVVQMDCDFSHDPEDVARLVAAAAEADVVLGSRYVEGGATENWGLVRRLISRGGCLYARVVLWVPIRDLTGGFKCIRREALMAVDVDSVGASGYGFQIETTYRALRRGEIVREVPIVFRERRAGASKMSIAIVVEAMLLVPRLRSRRRATSPWRAIRPEPEHQLRVARQLVGHRAIARSEPAEHKANIGSRPT